MRRTPRREAPALALSLTLTLAPAIAFATVIQMVTSEQLARGAPVVVRGTVGAQQARWDDEGRRIHTFTELKVTETFKGGVDGLILVRQPGGEVGRIGAHVAGAARFREGEDVVLFLEPAADDPSVFIVQAMGAGKVTLERTKLGEVRARRDLRGISAWSPEPSARGEIREVGGVEDLGEADAFLQSIRAATRASRRSGGAR